MFVVVVLVFYGPSTLFRSFRVLSVNLSILFLGKPPRQLNYQYLVHILLPVTDNCPSWISGREKMALEIISWPISMKDVAGCEDQTRSHLHSRRMRIQSSYRAQHLCLWLWSKNYSHTCYVTVTSIGQTVPKKLMKMVMIRNWYNQIPHPADAQAGLHLCCSHMAKTGFLIRRLSI